MHFLSPAWLVLLLGVAALAAVYVWFQLRRPSQAVRFSNLDLLASVAPSGPRWRKHVVAGVFGAAMVLLVVALAQPAREVQVPVEEATIVLAIDVSLSMEADDVEPTRIEAARVAAAQFVETVPEQLNVGLVSFSGTTAIEVAPTTDREAVVDAILDLELDEGTAIGDGIAASVRAIGDVATDEDGATPPGAVVLISDGDNQLGRPLSAAISEAQEAGVPVSTIAYGTATATIEDPLTGGLIPVPVNEQALRTVADETGGTSFDAESAEELDAVYANIGSQIGYDTEDRDISRWFLGAGLITCLVCAGLSLAWSSRIL